MLLVWTVPPACVRKPNSMINPSRSATPDLVSHTYASHKMSNLTCDITILRRLTESLRCTETSIWHSYRLAKHIRFHAMPYFLSNIVVFNRAKTERNLVSQCPPLEFCCCVSERYMNLDDWPKVWLLLKSASVCQLMQSSRYMWMTVCVPPAKPITPLQLASLRHHGHRAPIDGHLSTTYRLIRITDGSQAAPAARGRLELDGLTAGTQNGACCGQFPGIQTQIETNSFNYALQSDQSTADLWSVRQRAPPVSSGGNSMSIVPPPYSIWWKRCQEFSNALAAFWTGCKENKAVHRNAKLHTTHYTHSWPDL